MLIKRPIQAPRRRRRRPTLPPVEAVLPVLIVLLLLMCLICAVCDNSGWGGQGPSVSPALNYDGHMGLKVNGIFLDFDGRSPTDPNSNFSWK